MAIQAGRVGVRTDQVDAYGRVNDTSFFNKIIDKLITWVDLPVWKGGTEQLLPENDDEPETSPILCDIDYPDQEREDQYFIYRESPTGSDGIAKIESIRGNTLVWNQLARVNSSSSSTTNGITYSFSDGKTIAISGTASANAYNFLNLIPKTITGHVYLAIKNISDVSKDVQLYNDSGGVGVLKNVNASIGVATASKNWYLKTANGESFSSAVTVVPQIFDLTAMFGSGNEPSTVEEFTSLFPLPYYSYSTGSLLSFNGTGIKTVGKNLVNATLDGEAKRGNGHLFTLEYGNNSVTITPVVAGSLYVIWGICQITDNLVGKYFYASGTVTGGTLKLVLSDNIGNWDGGVTSKNSPYTITSSDVGKMLGVQFFNATGQVQTASNIMAEFGNTASDFTPYKSNTLSLPISTYFPTGMKSAGEVYDELLPRRATTNVGEVDLGSFTWEYVSDSTVFRTTVTGKKNGLFNILCSKYIVTSAQVAADMNNGEIRGNRDNASIIIKDLTYNDPADFKTAVTGVMLNYELAEPIVLPTIDFGD